MTKLLKIKDAEGQSEDDVYLAVPDGMGVEKAVDIVDAALRQVKAAAENGYQWDDLCVVLRQHGFDMNLQVTIVNEVW